MKKVNEYKLLFLLYPNNGFLHEILGTDCFAKIFYVRNGHRNNEFSKMDDHELFLT